MRNQQLDILRAIAVFLVLGRHWEIFAVWSRAGWAGVDLFFVLSGFLISGLMYSEFKRTGGIRIPHFWARRGLKIYPAFYALMLVVSLIHLIEGKGSLVWSSRMLHEVFFVQDYFPGVLSHTWTLAVEEQFYLTLPLLLWVMIRFSRDRENPFRSVVGLYILLALSALGLRIHAGLDPNINFYDYLYPAHLRADALMCGVALGYLFHFKPEIFQNLPRAPLLCAGILLVSPCVFLPVESVFMRTVGLTLVYLGFACILIVSINTAVPKTGLIGWAARRLARIGFYSYSIYLWHFTVKSGFVVAERRFHAAPASWMGRAFEHYGFAGYLAASVLWGIFAAKVVELPALAIRDRVFPSRSGTTIAQPVPSAVSVADMPVEAAQPSAAQ